MTQKTFCTVVGFIFSLVTLVHILRIALHWQFTVGGVNIPMWASVAGIVVGALLAYHGFKFGRK